MAMRMTRMRRIFWMATRMTRMWRIDADFFNGNADEPDVVD
jgi:hypothetical protein